jgi:hypothetical protein
MGCGEGVDTGTPEVQQAFDERIRINTQIIPMVVGDMPTTFTNFCATSHYLMNLVSASKMSFQVNLSNAVKDGKLIPEERTNIEGIFRSIRGLNVPNTSP